MFGLSKNANRFLIGSLVAVVLGALFFLILTVRFFSITIKNQAAGSEFGREHDAQACIDEGVRRHTVTIDPITHVAESSFVQTCLMAAKPNAEFCRDVPEFDFINQAPAVAWADSKCNEKGFSDGGCRSVFLAVVTACKMLVHKEGRVSSSQ